MNCEHCKKTIDEADYLRVFFMEDGQQTTNENFCDESCLLQSLLDDGVIANGK